MTAEPKMLLLLGVWVTGPRVIPVWCLALSSAQQESSPPGLGKPRRSQCLRDPRGLVVELGLHDCNSNKQTTCRCNSR